MPRSDLSRAELLQYVPQVEPPPDLDEFWAKALDELSEVPFGIEVAETGLELRGVRCSKLSFRGLGRARVDGWYVRPYGDGPFPGLACYHGYGGRGARPVELYSLAAQGIAVLSMDCRGQCGDVIDPHVGDSGGHARGWLTMGIRSPETYYYRSLYADAVRAVEVLCALDGVDADRIAVTGPSQGGGLSLAAAALSPIPTFVWADIPFLCHFERAVDLASEGPYPEIAEFVRRMPDLEPAVWRTLSYFDNLVLAPRVTAATVITAGLWDDVCPPSTIFPTFMRLGAADKELLPYSFLGHELSYEIEEARLLTLVERLGP